VGVRRYSSRQVEAWAPDPGEPEGWNRRAQDGRTVLVAVNDADEPIAYGDLESCGHIDHLFCSPAACGAGVASAIVDELERVALAKAITRLYVEASECALALFERKGSARLERRDFPLRGVMIHHYALEKFISSPS